MLTSSGAFRNINPIRYRGYYFDTETGLYYLKSRYYDPEVGRFINADVLADTDRGSTGLNLFAYCGCDPINRTDDGGGFWHYVVGAAIGGAVGLVSAAASGGDTLDIVIGTLAGAGSGALAASGAGVLFQGLGNAAISMTSNIAQQANHIYLSKSQDSFDLADAAIDGAISFTCGIWGGNGASYGNVEGIMSSGKQLLSRGLFDPKAQIYYAKTAHRTGGEYVINSLYSSLKKSSMGSFVMTVKNILR